MCLFFIRFNYIIVQSIEENYFKRFESPYHNYHTTNIHPTDNTEVSSSTPSKGGWIHKAEKFHKQRGCYPVSITFISIFCLFRLALFS